MNFEYSVAKYIDIVKCCEKIEKEDYNQYAKDCNSEETVIGKKGTAQQINNQQREKCNKCYEKLINLCGSRSSGSRSSEKPVEKFSPEKMAERIKTFYEKATGIIETGGTDATIIDEFEACYKVLCRWFNECDKMFEIPEGSEKKLYPKGRNFEDYVAYELEEIASTVSPIASLILSAIMIVVIIVLCIAITK